MQNDEWIDGESPEAPNAALGWRRRLEKWPDEWRERWGLRANLLEEQGLHWIEAEKQAWNETIKLKANQPSPAVERPRTTMRPLWQETAA